jgi:hypothetical protein
MTGKIETKISSVITNLNAMEASGSVEWLGVKQERANRGLWVFHNGDSGGRYTRDTVKTNVET